MWHDREITIIDHVLLIHHLWDSSSEGSPSHYKGITYLESSKLQNVGPHCNCYYLGIKDMYPIKYCLNTHKPNHCHGPRFLVQLISCVMLTVYPHRSCLFSIPFSVNTSVSFVHKPLCIQVWVRLFSSCAHSVLVPVPRSSCVLCVPVLFSVASGLFFGWFPLTADLPKKKTWTSLITHKSRRLEVLCHCIN